MLASANLSAMESRRKGDFFCGIATNDRRITPWIIADVPEEVRAEFLRPAATILAHDMMVKFWS